MKNNKIRTIELYHENGDVTRIDVSAAGYAATLKVISELFEDEQTPASLKACPNCGKTVYFGRSEGCVICPACDIHGPSDDQDGAKWNSLPRRE